LARLIAERSVVFLRDQTLSPQEQLRIGEHFGPVEIHPSAPHVPGLPGVQVIWTKAERENIDNRRSGGTGFWHADISACTPPGITHLHMVSTIAVFLVTDCE
jgi:alpha-ketoglutarate-dependent taurine dioxygenase